MKIFIGLRVSSKILFLIVCSSVFLLISSLTSYYELSITNTYVDTMYNKELKQIQTISDLRKLNSDNQTDFLLFILSSKEDKSQFLSKIEENKKKIFELVSQYQNLNLDEYQGGQLDVFNADYISFGSFSNQIMQVAQTNDASVAFVTFNSGNSVYDGLD